MPTRYDRRSPLGADDQQGPLGQITAAMIAPLFQGVREGRVIDLGHEIAAGVPRMEPFMVPYTMSMFATAAKTQPMIEQHMGATNGAGAQLESVHMTMQTGTHIDALGHFALADELYNGYSAAEVTGDWGLGALGIEQCPPVITRGVVLDLARAGGDGDLGAGTPIRAADLEAAARSQGVTVRAGDAVLVNTGWGRHYMVDNETYVAGEPGLTADAARWLSGQGVAVVGADNMALEVLPFEKPDEAFPVHAHFLVEAGVYIIENIRLDEVCRDRLYEFLFIALPVKYAGATGSTLRPVAVV